MRKFLLLFTLITCTVIGVWAQSGRFQPAVAGVHPATSLNLSNQEVVNQKDVSEYQRCFTVENEAQIRAANPSLPTEAEFETWMARKIEERKAAGITERATYSIPYIVHIIHDGEAIGVGDNISDAKVYAQMSQINDDFQRMNSDAGNTPAAFTGVAGSIDIEFVPAIIDNNGDTMTTPGIRRINRNTQGWSAPPYGGNACLTTGFDNSYIEGTIKPASQWDPTKYMNIWALDMTCGILGYAQFPTGSGLPGLPGSATSNTDGLVLLSSSMGSIANPGSGAPFNLGRTATHEIGHWLGLRHIWGDGTCATDYCDDTPTQSGPNESNCPSFPSVSCSNGPNGDMFMNYMDYTTDACMNIFTEDQVSRFEAVLNNSPRRVELLSSTVGGQVPAEDTCDAGDLTVADSVGLCTGTSVTVSNNGTNTIPSGGGYGFLFTPGADGTGALGGEFLLSGTGTSRTIDESLGGLLPGNSFPNFAGTWYVSGAVYSDGSSGQAAANSVCDLTDSYFVITFIDSADALCDTVVLDPCTAGTLANSDSVGVCEGETFTIETNGDHEFPAAGGYGWNFSPGADGTGGPFAGAGFSYSGAGPIGNTWDNSLNGLLTGLEMEGTWIITGFSYADTNDVSGSLCGFTPTDKIVNFLASNDPACALVEICNNGIDDDGDGQIDCLDGDCATDSNCALASDSCEAPTDLSIDNITSSSADFSWSGAGTFDVELVDITASGTATETPTATDVSNPYTFDGLASNNDYEAYVRSNCQGNDLILTGAYDGPLTGGTPKGVEIYVLNDIADLSAYGIGSANNGGGTDGQEFTFSGSATAGSFIYVTTDSTRFHEFFGFAADFVDGSMAINGDDAIELFFNGNVLDIFGDINTDGSFTAWDYLDGWAYRKDNTGPEGAIFTISNWDYSGINNLENGTTNATCTSPFPIGTFSTTGRVASEWVGPIPFTTTDIVVAGPANDSCAGAVVIACPTGFEGIFDPSGATADDAPNSCAGTVGPGVWFKFVGTGQDLNINVTPYGWDAEVQLFSGSCGSLFCEQNEDDPETITGFTTQNGTDYYIYVGTWSSSDTDIDSFYLSVSCSEPVTCDPFVGDSVENPIVIGSLPYSDIQNQGECFTDQYAQAFESPDVVYEITTGSNTDSLIIDLCNDTTDFDTYLYLSDGNITLVDNDDSPFGGICSYLAVDVEPNTTYYIIVEGLEASDLGWFEITVEERELPEPPSCAAPTALLAENVTSTTADLSWTPGGNETVWHLEITDGAFTGVPTVIGLTDTFYLATALDSLTDYSFYVIADCGTDSSEWAGPEDFTTLGTVVGPSNDDCANATPLVCNAPALTGQTTDGTVAEDDPVGCASEYGVWYSFVGDGSEVTITSANNSFDHELDIFSSDSDCNGTFTTVTCRDASVGAESYTFTTTIGTQYYVYVAHFSTSSLTTGTFDIEMTCETAVAPPANDSCGGAVVITCPTGFEGVVDPAGATAGDAPDVCAGTVGPGVWYKYVGDGQVLDINVTPYGWDAEVQLLSGSCGSFVCEQNADDPESITGFTTQVGTDYYIYVSTFASFDTDIDSFYLSVSCSDPVTCDPFVGDSVENPIVIGSLPYSDIQNQGECFTDQYAQAFESPDVVYEITTGPNTDSLIIDLCNDTTDFDTWMYLSDGIGTLEDNNNSPFGGVCSYLAVDVEPNTTYYIIVEGNFPTDLGWFEITVEEIELPEPPSCATPTALTAENVTSTTADLSWTPGGDETVWHLEITDGPFTGVPTVSGLTDTFYLATGLDSLTEYSFYVIADCGTDSSEWAGPEDFATLGTTEEPCEVWINPTPTTGWVDFNTIYGGAPCDDGGGCPFNEIDAFEVWASEAYNVENFIAGGEYTFSMCNGPGAGSWVPEFTIIAPSGAIDAFGPGDGDGCSISWTASESGTYLIVINEAGLCGTSTNTATDNGFPALTCNSGGLAACLPPPEAPINDTCSGAIAITCPSGFEGTVDASGATATDAPLCNGSSTGAGVWYTYEGDGESLNIFVDPYGFDAEIQIHSGSCGALVCETSVDNGLSVGDPESISGFETVIGTTYYIYIGSWISTETVIDSFDLSITCGAIVCDAGSLAPSSIDSFAICPDSTVTIEGLGDETIPVGGGYGIFFVPGPGGTGALGDSFIFNNTPLPLTFDSDLNGVLSGNGFPEFEGTWYVQGATYTDPGNTFNTICDLTDDYMVVTFLAAGEGPCAPPPPAPINDTCSGAIAISCDDIIYGNTDNATADASLGTCGTGLTTAPGVWYVFAGTGEAVEFSLCDDTTDFDTKIGVFEGSCGALNCVAGNDDDCGLASTVEVNTVIGTDYYVYVTGFQTNTGNFGLSVTCSVIVPAPENDTCGGATVITCPSFFVSEDASNATLSDAPTCSGSTVGPGLWYTYTGDGSTLDITATPNDWDMEIQLFSGVCGDLVCEENADVGLDGDPESITDFQTVPGTQYYLYVGTWANFVDDIDAFDLEITCTPPPACDAPTALTVENITETSADLSWTPLSGESSWNIEIVDITDGGTFTGTPTVSGLTDTFYLAIGLNPANEYEFYVQADCDFDESEWAGPEPFETLTPAPSNDTCGGAIALTCGASLGNYFRSKRR
ncbi:MAG: fibronectin type III domain-containing protein [Chitinophagales bacterium]